MATKRRWRIWPQLLAAALMLFTSCRDRVVGPAEIVPEDGPHGIVPVGVVEITLTALGTDKVTAEARTPEWTFGPVGTGRPAADGCCCGAGVGREASTAPVVPLGAEAPLSAALVVP